MQLLSLFTVLFTLTFSLFVVSSVSASLLDRPFAAPLALSPESLPFLSPVVRLIPISGNGSNKVGFNRILASGLVISPTTFITNSNIPKTISDDKSGGVFVHVAPGSTIDMRDDSKYKPAQFMALNNDSISSTSSTPSDLLNPSFGIGTLNSTVDSPAVISYLDKIKFVNTSTINDGDKFTVVRWDMQNNTDESKFVIPFMIRDAVLLNDSDCNKLFTKYNTSGFGPHRGGRYMCTQSTIAEKCDDIFDNISILLKSASTDQNADPAAKDDINIAGIDFSTKCEGTRMYKMWVQPAYFVGKIAEYINVGTDKFMLPTRSSSSKLSSGAIVGIVVGSIVFIALVIAVIVYIVRRRGRESRRMAAEQTAVIKDLNNLITRIEQPVTSGYELYNEYGGAVYYVPVTVTGVESSLPDGAQTNQAYGQQRESVEMDTLQWSSPVLTNTNSPHVPSQTI
ncbi:hypothetical protein GQ42DRAFT_53385 [Ramicandelaber brevisporus]|nr:hypothetical protein GQ42DRAFT_53385 [Ramicandelaber brevisporus]